MSFLSVVSNIRLRDRSAVPGAPERRRGALLHGIRAVSTPIHDGVAGSAPSSMAAVNSAV